MMGSIVVWYASAITGGLADTMEDENLKTGMAKIGGCIFDTPDKRTIFFAEAACSRPAPK